MTGDVVLAVDIGGTKTAAALVDPDGLLRERAAGPTPATEGPAAVVAHLARLADELLGRRAVRLRGVGIGTAGVVDTSTGTIVSSTETLAGWAGTPRADLVRDALGARLESGAPVRVRNDVDAHAIGEFRHGAAAGAGSALVVAVGTGVGGGVILDGRTWEGARHVAGEIAHMPTPGAEHLRCPCGRMGHLEAIGGGVGLHRHYLWLGGDPSVTDTRGVVARADRDERARRAVHDSAAAVGRAIAGAATLLDPETIVVTGGVAQIGDRWWTPMEEAFRATVIDALALAPLVPGVLGADAPLRGAAATVWDVLEDTP